MLELRNICALDCIGAVDAVQLVLLENLHVGQMRSHTPARCRIRAQTCKYREYRFGLIRMDVNVYTRKIVEIMHI